MTSLTTESAALRVTGALDVAALAEAIHELAARDRATASDRSAAADQLTIVERTRRAGRPDDLLHDLIDAPWREASMRWRVFVVASEPDDQVILLCGNPSAAEVVSPREVVDDLAAYYHRAVGRACLELPLDTVIADQRGGSPHDVLRAAVRLVLDRYRGESPTVTFAELVDLVRAADPAPALPGLRTTWWPATRTAWDEDTAWLLNDPERPSVLIDGASSPHPVERFAAHLRVVLALVTAQPDVELARVDIRTDDERARLAAWNATDQDIPALTLPELVEAQVERTPELPALCWPGGVLDYAELNARANRLAAALIARGAGPGRTVALVLPRSPDLAIATLAVSKTGAAFLPIDPSYPPARISYLLSDTRPLLALTSAEIDLPAGTPRHVIATTESGTTMDGEPLSGPAHDPTDADRTAPLRLGNVAYTIYTSGTTGYPKGVLIPHTGLNNFTRYQAARTGIRPGDRVLQYASPSFDASVLEFLLALPTGAALVTPEPGPLLGEALAATLRRERITHALIPPAALATVPAAEAARLPDLRHLIVGGDATTPDLVEIWAPGRELTNAYGPTEVTIAATWSGPLVPSPEPPTIGTPLSNTRVHLLDRYLQPVPPGSTGGVHVATPALAHGYHNQPGLTAANFIANPFGRPGGRMYHTGDLAHHDRDGNLHYHGRDDHQTKIRGNRIELSEIRDTLQRHPTVRQAVVTTHTGRGHKQLVGYVVPEAGAHCSPPNSAISSPPPCRTT